MFRKQGDNPQDSFQCVSKVETSPLLPKWKPKIFSANLLSSGSKANGWIWRARQESTCSWRRPSSGKRRCVIKPHSTSVCHPCTFNTCTSPKDPHLWNAHHQSQGELRRELQMRGHLQGQVWQLLLWLGSKRLATWLGGETICAHPNMFWSNRLYVVMLQKPEDHRILTFDLHSKEGNGRQYEHLKKKVNSS